MQKMHFITITVILILTSCKALVETGVVKGVVKDATTGHPISNADVFLLRNEIADGDIWNGGGPSEQMDYTTSDANGVFTFHFDYNKNYYYLCGSEKDLYFDLNQEFKVDDEIKDGVNVEILLNPIAWLKVHYRNDPPALTTDILGVNGYITEVLYGSEIDTSLTYKTQGNVWSKIYWAIGYEPTNIDSIYCPAFDTTYFEILY